MPQKKKTKSDSAHPITNAFEDALANLDAVFGAVCEQKIEYQGGMYPSATGADVDLLRSAIATVYDTLSSCDTNRHEKNTDSTRSV